MKIVNYKKLMNEMNAWCLWDCEMYSELFSCVWVTYVGQPDTSVITELVTWY